MPSAALPFQQASLSFLEVCLYWDMPSPLFATSTGEFVLAAEYMRHYNLQLRLVGCVAFKLSLARGQHLPLWLLGGLWAGGTLDPS